MDPVPVSSVAYATPGADAPPRVGVRTAVAAVWLLAILAVIAAAFEQFTLQQEMATYVRAYLFRFGSLDAMDRVLRWSVGPAAVGLMFGMAAAAVLWHWVPARLAWATAVPVVAAVWGYFDPVASVRPSQVPTGVPTLLVAFVQCAGVYAGTRCGRPVARWLANQFLPPALRPALVALWR